MTRALAAGDLERVGALLDASHASLRDDYEVSVPEVEQTVEKLKQAGAAGARIVGGGFGGSVLALLPRARPLPRGRSRSLRARRRGSCLLALDAQLLGHLLLLGSSFCASMICSVVSGRSFTQSRKLSPRASMPSPVHRLIRTPAALSIWACESMMP
jgi:hypothetical protein